MQSERSNSWVVHPATKCRDCGRVGVETASRAVSNTYLHLCQLILFESRGGRVVITYSRCGKGTGLIRHESHNREPPEHEY